MAQMQMLLEYGHVANILFEKNFLDTSFYLSERKREYVNILNISNIKMNIKTIIPSLKTKTNNLSSMGKLVHYVLGCLKIKVCSIKAKCLLELKMCSKMLSQIFKEHGYTVFNVGRKGHHKEYEEESNSNYQIKKLRLKCEITKIWEHLNKGGVVVFQLTEKAQKRNKIRCRYLISHINAVWHGDIHRTFIIYSVNVKQDISLL